MSAPRNFSRRERQAANLYNSAGQITDFPTLHSFLDLHGPNTTPAMIAGARACQMADGPAVLWPVFHPSDILKPAGRQLIGAYWSGPGVTPGKKGKAFINKRSGGMLFGVLESARTLYIAADPNRALAIHGSTGQPCLCLFSPGGLKGLAEATIRGIAPARLSVVILNEHKHADAAVACAMQIRFTAPEIKVQIFPFSDWGDEWLDNLAEAAFLEAETTPPKPISESNDFLAGPNLSGGPLGPEPPPIDVPFTKNNVIPHMPWRRRADAPERPVLPPLEDMQADLRAALPGAIQAAIAGKPVLIMVPPGGGKSRMTLEALLATRVDAGDGRARPANFLWATATKNLADEAFKMAGSNHKDMVWDGRGVEGLCKRPVATQCLMNRGRSPHQNACMKCEFGVKPEDDEDDERCRFQKNLSGAPFRRGIFGQHGIVGKESTLLKWAADPRDDFQDRDTLVIDEGVPAFAKGEVRIDDVTAARVAALGIEDHISHLKSRNTKRKAGKKTRDDEDEARFSEDDFQKARDWATAITPHLDALGGHLIQAAAQGEGLRALDPQISGEFAKIATRIPPAARAADASALEKVQDIFGDKRVVPLAWIASLGCAVQAGTAWVRVGKGGAVSIVYTNPSDLWARYLKKGGLLLDASCTHVDEIVGAGGVVIDLRCAQPNLKVIQYGPLLHGKGDIVASEKGMKRLKAEAKALQDAMGDDPDVVVITHKALAGHIKDDRVRHWGTHKGHNNWKDKRRLILWGLPLMNANDQIIGYKTYRVAMAARGIDLPDWNGERVREWTQAGEWDIFPAAKLPSVKEARDWLLRQVNADVFQAIGRLRAVWATSPVTVEIHGFLPVVGFGMQVDEIRLESRGRLHTKTRARAIIAQGVADLGEARTRAKLQEYFKKHAGHEISKDQCDKLVAELKVQALQSAVTLHEAARQSCATNTRLLEAGHEPQAIAQAARKLGGLPGVVAVADLLDQIKRAPGAQRAGP